MDDRSVVGELVGAELELLPVAVVRWSDARDTHPDALVLSRTESLFGRYGQNPYGAYGSGFARAIFDGVVVAESDDVRVVEGMTYFPVESVNTEVLVESPTTSRCFWKGKASYWHVQGRSDVAANAAFAYERPWPLARKLVNGRVAFWQGVQVTHD